MIYRNRWSRLLLCLLVASPGALADRYLLDPAAGDLIGEPRQASARHEDTLLDLARRYKLGYDEIVNANPGVDPWMPGAGVQIELSKLRILPAAERRGIVINLPEHRLYFFTPDGSEVYSYPVSIGKMDWNTPLGSTRIVSKVKDPPWYPPESVRREHAAKGDMLPAVVPPGPDNPLGRYAMRLGIPGGAYLIHGTNRPAGVGMQVTHGCMRLYPEDIEALFGMAPVNTPVTIVNQPFKVGWRDGQLWVEVHPSLKEDVVEPPTMTDLARLVVEAARQSLVPVNWSAVQQAYLDARGMPVPVTVAGALTAREADAQKKGPAA